jgi:hypothetical protein
MKKFVSFAVTAVAMVLAFVVAGCNDGGGTQTVGGNPAGGNHGTGTAKLFKADQAKQTVWVLYGYNGAFFDMVPQCNFEGKCYTLEFLTDSTFITYSATNEFYGTYVADYESSGINIITSFGGTKVGSMNLHDWWDVFPKIDKFTLNENELKFYYDEEQHYLLFKPLL